MRLEGTMQGMARDKESRIEQIQLEVGNLTTKQSGALPQQLAYSLDYAIERGPEIDSKLNWAGIDQYMEVDQGIRKNKKAP